MATSKEKRAWLVAHGHPELENGAGRMPAELLAEFDAAHRPPPADDYGPGAGPADFVAAADPPEDDYPPAPDAYPGDPLGDLPGPGVAEQPPGRPPRARFRLPWHPREDQPARPRGGRVRAFARVSLAPLIEDTYSDIAWSARSIPPLQRLLYAQAPIAGVVLDPVVKDTVADRVVQPVARNYERGKVGLALVGSAATLMAALVTAPQPVMVDGVVQWQAVVDDDGQPVLADDGETPMVVMRMTEPTIQHQTAIVGLRYCVRAMADISGDALTRVQQRAEENAQRDAVVDDFMAYLMGYPVAADPAGSARGDGAAAGLRLAGATE